MIRTRFFVFLFGCLDPETMAAGENRFAPGLNEKDNLEYATPWSTKETTKYGMGKFKGKNLKI